MVRGGWGIFGASVRGATHQRRGQTNQDALHWWPPQTASAETALALADGHGSALYVRSAVGARAAVCTATALLWSLGERRRSDSELALLHRESGETLPRQLVRSWRNAVLAHHECTPLAELEEAQVEAAGPIAAARAADDPAVLYGSTLVAVLLTARYLLFVQLGDGDILVVDDDGTVAQPGLAADPLLFANTTTSLCSPEAWRHVRTYLQPIVDRPPALILLATDGYVNSFADRSGFEAVGSGLLELLRREGPGFVQGHLTEWLAETSAAGSGDDISAGLAWRIGA